MKTLATALVAAALAAATAAPALACPMTDKSSASLTDNGSYQTAQKDKGSSSQSK